MVLTAQDVHEKQFKLVRGNTGYDMDEVDAFLDQIESELARLNQLIAEQQHALSAAADSAVHEVPATPEQNAMAAARILELAQRTADEHVAQADQMAEQILSEARSRSEAAVAELESRRTELTTNVEQLVAFETDLRTRLRGYLQTQLRQLDDSDPGGWGMKPDVSPEPLPDQADGGYQLQAYDDQQVPELA